MKKSLLIPLLLTPSLLLSCGVKEAISSQTSSSDPSSSKEPQKELTPENVIATLLESEKGDYEVYFTSNGRQYTDVYTENYIYYESLRSGYALLDSYKPTDGKVGYYFSVQDGKAAIHDVLPPSITGSESLLRSLSSFNLLGDMKAATLLPSSFQRRGDALTSSDPDLLVSFSTLLEHYESYVEGYITGISFYFAEDNSLVFTLEQPLTTPSDAILPALERSGALRNVGHASSSMVEEAISSFSIPEQTLSKEALSPLTGNRFEGTGTIYKVTDGKESLYGTLSLKYNDHAVELRDTIEGKREFVHFEKGANGEILRQALDVSNKKVEQAYGDYRFEDLAFGYNSYIEPEAFRKTSEGTYHYFGYTAPQLASSLTYIDVAAGVTGVGVHLTNGKVSSLTFTTSEIGQDSVGQTVYYRIELLVSSSSSDPWVVAPFTESDPSIAKAVETLTKSDASFKARSSINEENRSYAETTLAGDILLLKKVVAGSDGKEPLFSYQGYKRLSDGNLQKFSVDEAGEVTAVGGAFQGSLSDYYWKPAPEVFEMEEGKTSFRPRSETAGYAGKVIPGFFGEYLLDNTLSFTLEGGRIASFSYDYDLNGLSKLHETVTLDYGSEGSPIAIEAALKAKIDALTEKSAPSSWLEEENETAVMGVPASFIRDSLTTLYGEEVAKAIPYVYKASFSGNWFADARYSYDANYNRTLSGLNLSLYDDEVPSAEWKSYCEELGSKFKEAGYSSIESSSAATYRLGTVSVTLHTDLASNGIDFALAA